MTKSQKIKGLVGVSGIKFFSRLNYVVLELYYIMMKQQLVSIITISHINT